jgi:hypothetical protein
VAASPRARTCSSQDRRRSRFSFAEAEEAARLSDTPSGATIRILGSLAWDAATKRFAISVLDLKQTAPPRNFRPTLRETIKDALPYST